MILKSTVYVTGAAGMIGSNFCRVALLSGYRVIGVDNLSRGRLENIAPFLRDDNFEFVHSDIASDLEWAKNISQSDIVVHLADIVGGIGFVARNEWSIFNTNIRINSNIARILNLFKPKQLVYVGTACSYPKGMQRSINTSGLIETDKYPADPESGYGWSKLIGDIEYSMLCKENDIVYTNLDLHNVYGSPCDFNPTTAQVLPSLIFKALTTDLLEIWGDGEQGRAFVEVRDVAAAILAAINFGKNGCFMIGPSVCTTINSIANILITNPKVKAKSMINDLSKPVGDIGRFYSGRSSFDTLGWSPTITIDQGLSDLIDYIAGRLNL